MIKEIVGDLIELTRQGEFNIILHGCNCFCAQGAGIAKQMNTTFKTLSFNKEQPEFKGDINKLGTIDYKEFEVSSMSVLPSDYRGFSTQELRTPLIVINAYTQYYYGNKPKDKFWYPLDYEALRMCLRKVNFLFKGKILGIPGFLGCGLAGGDWSIVNRIITEELKDMEVRIVFLPKKK